VKNLTSATETKTVAGESNGNIIEYAWQLKKRGLSETTIKHRNYLLNVLIEHGANLDNPDSVETILATESFTTSMKAELVRSYKSYTKFSNIAWQPIRIRYQPKQPFIPLESELDQLIAGSGKRTATFLQVLKDTGARAGEVCKLRWTDVNRENNTISINTPEKNSNPRTIKVSSKTISMIQNIKQKHGEYIFNPKLSAIQDAFHSKRRTLAHTLQNPRLLQIHFHTFRHWKATMEYAKTKDILYVMHLLGHKSIQNTLIYTQLVNFENNEYHSAVAENIDQAKKLVEDGFEYVCTSNNTLLFRKRK
jgi:integrase